MDVRLENRKAARSGFDSQTLRDSMGLCRTAIHFSIVNISVVGLHSAAEPFNRRQPGGCSGRSPGEEGREAAATGEEACLTRLLATSTRVAEDPPGLVQLPAGKLRPRE